MHVFQPEAVKGAESLKCPQCGSIFNFRGSESKVPTAPIALAAAPAGAGLPSPALPSKARVAVQPTPPKSIPKTAGATTPVSTTPNAAPSRAAPVARAVPAAAPLPSEPPLARPVQPQTTQSSDMPGPLADLSFDDAAPSGTLRRRGGKRRRWPALIAGLIVMAVLAVTCGGVVAVAFWLVGQSDDFAATAAEGNFAFIRPGKPWVQDKEVQLKLQAHLAMKRGRPDAHFALFFKDFKTRMPSDAELRQEAVNRVKALFPDTPEMEPHEASDQTQLGGEAARTLEFSGVDENSVLMNGSCYMVTHQGYAYWFFTWGPQLELEALKPEWEQVRGGFRLGNSRPGWQPLGRPTEIARSSSGSKPRFQLKYVKGLWKIEPITDANRTQYDKADLVLTGMYSAEGKPSSKAATAATAQVVILRDKQDVELKEAIDAAHSFVLERYRAKGENGDFLFPDTKLELVQDTALQNIDEPIGKGRDKGQVQKLLVENDPNRHRYVVLRIMNSPQGVVVLWLECDNHYRDYWDSEFMTLLETFEFQ
jgi:hypothetical protein